MNCSKISKELRRKMTLKDLIKLAIINHAKTEYKSFEI
jgi:hypothetical protein